MNTISLSFNDVNFHPLEKQGQIWLTGGELANALGYARVDSLNKVYERNLDEFAKNMTQVIDITENVNLTSPNLVTKTRIFSLRGCHLIAMFSKTKIAKQFRKWVLDVLDKEVGNATPTYKTTKEERVPLTSAVNLLVAKTKHLNYSDAYKLVHQKFGIEHIDELIYDQVQVAVEYVHHLIVMYSHVKSYPSDKLDLVQKLIDNILLQNFMLENVWESLRQLDTRTYLKAMRYVVDSSVSASDVVKAFNFTDKKGLPMISKDYRTVNLYRGETLIDYKPNYFNASA